MGNRQSVVGSGPTRLPIAHCPLPRSEATTMYGENGAIVDVDEVRDAIARADVLIVGFRTFPERLLIDARSNDAAGPMARVVEPLGGVEERMHWLGRTRPQFGLPERFT